MWDERRGKTRIPPEEQPHAFKALSSERVDDEVNKFLILDIYINNDCRIKAKRCAIITPSEAKIPKQSCKQRTNTN